MDKLEGVKGGGGKTLSGMVGGGGGRKELE